MSGWKYAEEDPYSQSFFKNPNRKNYLGSKTKSIATFLKK
jgi:hypothetical protein